MRKLFIVVMVSFLCSCDDVLIQELDDVNVTMITPTRVDSTNSAAITFWWEEEELADKYRIQIVRPDFANLEEIEVDTFIYGLNFIGSLEPGDYEWVIRAVNDVSETENPMINQLYVDENIDLSTFKPILTFPINGTGVRNNEVVRFRWNGHPGADYYEINLNNKTDNQAKIIKVLADGGNPEKGEFDTTFSFLSNRNHEWSVKAFNSGPASISSEVESFVVDTAVVLQ